MSRHRRIPVLIVGGGPAGLAAACELRHHRIPCLVVEPRRTVSDDRPRAKTISARTMELFRRWGLAEDVRRAAPLSPEWSDRVVFCESLSGRFLTEFTDCFGLTVSADLAAERGQQMPQPLVERVLRQYLSEQVDVELMVGARVTDLVDGPDGVIVKVQEADGETTFVQAEYVLGCDGAGGVTRARCGIYYRGLSDSRPNTNIVFRAPGLATDLGPAVQYWVVGAQTSGLLGRLDLVDRWWAIVPGADLDAGADPSRLLNRLVGHDFKHEIVATDPWSARMLVADRFGRGRVFLVGEAAHVNPPWGGHGYNTSVGDAVNVGWKVAAVLHGWADPALLESYEQERRPIAQQTVQVAAANLGVLATDLADRAAGADVTALAALIQQTKRAEFHSLGLVLGYGYAGSPIVQAGAWGFASPSGSWGASGSGASGAGSSGSSSGSSGSSGASGAGDPTTYRPTTEPGRRLPHALRADGTSLYDSLGRGFTLLGPAREQPAVAALAAVAGRLGIPFTVVPTPPDYPWRDEFLLVRPDQHIAARSHHPGGINLPQAVARRP